MKVLAVCQQKGGVGKTSVARMICEYAAAQRGLKVLAIDLDSQCSLSQRFLDMDADETSMDGILPPLHPDYDPEEDPEWNGRSSIADMFVGKPMWPYETRIPNLEILPGDGDMLRKVELVTQEEVALKIHDRLRDFLRDPQITSYYDLVVIDTPPAKGPLTISAVRAATHLVIPITMAQQSMEGLRGMMQLWRRESRGRREPLHLVGILVNLFRSNVSLQSALLENLRQDPNIQSVLIPHVLGQRADFAESDHPDAKPKSVFDLPPSNLANQEALDVAKYIMEKLEL